MGSDWEDLTLEDVAENTSRPFDLKNRASAVFINTGDVLDGRFLHADESETCKMPGQAKKKIIKGDILFSEIRPANGRYALVDFDSDEYVVSTKFMVITLTDERVYKPYFYKVLTSQPTLNEFQRIAESRSGTFPQITFDAISYYPFSLPPLPEQKAIAHILGSLDDKIELNRHMNETLEAMAQALFKSWFVDFDPVIDNALATGNPIPEELADRAALRKKVLEEKGATTITPHHSQFPATFAHTEELGWIPEGWEVKPLGEESIILNGYAFKSEDYCEDGIFVLRTKNFDANGLSSRRDDDVFLPDSFSDSHESYLSQPFDFHLVMVGASIGKTSLLLPHMLPALRNQNMWCFRPKAESMSKIFLNLSVQKKVEEVMSWASGSARSFFRKSDFRSHEILIPTKELLAQFEETVGPMYLKISSGSAETDQLTKLRDTLLPKLISGELRTPEAAKLTEDALA